MKPFIVVQGPVATRSGYGNHTRDLVTSLIKTNKYDIQIISLPWGSTPTDALKNDNPEHMEIRKRIATQNLSRQPDVFIQVSVPNEFQKIGKYNIGITAGIETTHVPAEFLQGANNMDLIITTSEHSKKGFDAVYDKLNKDTKQKEGILKIETPIEVLFEGADLNVYKKTSDIHESIKTELSDIKDDFCYLFVGHWLQGKLGHDRKDVGMMLKTFCEAFKRKSKHNRPGIILKTSHASFSIMDRDLMMQKIHDILAPYGDNIPNIYLLHGDLTDQEMNSLYNHPKVKAYCTLLPGKLTDVHNSAADKFILKGTQWFTVEYTYAAKVLQDVISNYKQYLSRSRKQTQYVKDNFSLEQMAKQFNKLVETGLESVPQQVSLNLPKLKSNKDSSKIKLPQLKKVKI
jgi:glycosyltransferase involved in cell wall biosynthesis